MKSKRTIDFNGNEKWTNEEGKIHREDGLAVEYNYTRWSKANNKYDLSHGEFWLGGEQYTEQEYKTKIRPLLNPKDVNKSILSYKIWYNRFKCEWLYKHLCFAFVNDKLCAFDFSDELYNKMPHDMFLMDSNKALRVTINTAKIEDKTLMKNNYEIIEDDKYRFDDTEEKRKYITSILRTGLDLSESLEYCKAEVENVEVNMGSIDGYSVYRTLKEVYADESA